MYTAYTRLQVSIRSFHFSLYSVNHYKYLQSFDHSMLCSESMCTLHKLGFGFQLGSFEFFSVLFTPLLSIYRAFNTVLYIQTVFLHCLHLALGFNLCLSFFPVLFTPLKSVCIALNTVGSVLTACVHCVHQALGFN